MKIQRKFIKKYVLKQLLLMMATHLFTDVVLLLWPGHHLKKIIFQKLDLLRFSDRCLKSRQGRVRLNSWHANLKQTVLSRQFCVQMALYTDRPVAEPS